MSKTLDSRKIFDLEDLDFPLGGGEQEVKLPAFGGLHGGANGQLADLMKFMVEPQWIESFVDVADTLIKNLEIDGQPGISKVEAKIGIKDLLAKGRQFPAEAAKMIDDKVDELYGDKDVLPTKKFLDDYRDAMKVQDSQEQGAAKDDGKIDFGGAAKAFREVLEGKAKDQGDDQGPGIPVDPKTLNDGQKPAEPALTTG